MSLSYLNQHVLHSELFWIAFSALVTATSLAYTLWLKERIDVRRGLRNAKKALVSEIMLNIDMLFSGEVERQPLSLAMNLIRANFSGAVASQEKFDDLQRLYADLDYYKTFVTKVYLKVPNSGPATAYKQFLICNKVIIFFRDKPVHEENPTESEVYADLLRDKAILVMKKNREKWRRRIIRDIDIIFPT